MLCIICVIGDSRNSYRTNCKCYTMWEFNMPSQRKVQKQQSRGSILHVSNWVYRKYIYYIRHCTPLNDLHMRKSCKSGHKLLAFQPDLNTIECNIIHTLPSYNMIISLSPPDFAPPPPPTVVVTLTLRCMETAALCLLLNSTNDFVIIQELISIF